MALKFRMPFISNVAKIQTQEGDDRSERVGK